MRTCPFCGGKAHLSVDPEGTRDINGRLWAYTVVCERCAATSGLTFSEKMAIDKWNRRAGHTWHDFSDELPPGGTSVLCKGKNGALYVGKPVMFVDGTRTREVWVPRGNQYRTPEKWMEIEGSTD